MATTFQFPIPAPIPEGPADSSTNNPAKFVFQPTDTLTLANAVLELQTRIAAFNAATTGTKI